MVEEESSSSSPSNQGEITVPANYDSGPTATSNNNNGNGDGKNNESGNKTPSIRMVIQRYRKACVLLDESRVETVGDYSGLLTVSRKVEGNNDNDNNKDGNGYESNESHLPLSVGVLAYISFSKKADEQTVEQAAKTLLNLPILTLGAWGDGTTTKSMFQLLTESKSSSSSSSSFTKSARANLSVVLVPQANVIAKVRKNGKNIRYDDQSDKHRGRELYHCFCATVKTLLVEHQGICRGDNILPKKQPPSNNKPTSYDASIPPNELFRLPNPTGGADNKPQNNTYGSFDERGFPLTLANGESITKSARKKLQKIYDAQVKKHEKYLQKKASAKPPSPTTTVATTTSTKATAIAAKLDSDFCRVIEGSFGKRQGIELYSDMGPLCHVVEL